MFTLIEYIHRNPPVKNKSGVYVTKIAEIYQHNYISLNWLIHEEKMDMCRVQLKDSNFLIYFVLFRIAILNGYCTYLTLKFLVS